MNDRLSPNSVTLVEKVDGDEILFFRVRVRRNPFETSSERLRASSDIIGPLRKMLALSG